MAEYPRITYQYSGRSFDRLFKEQSLDETKNVVRRKLGLGHDDALELAQLRDGERIDLEDDDDFEAFKALIKTSLRATVTVGRPSSDPVNASGEWRRSPNDPEGAHSPSVSQPSTHSIDTPRPRKRRKVTSNGDLITTASPQPSQQLALEGVRPSSLEGSSTTFHKSTSEVVALPLSGPTTLHPASQAENMEADPATHPAETSRKKRKRNKTRLGNGPLPEPGVSNPGDVAMSPHTQKKRRKDQPAVSVIPVDDNATPTGIGTGDGEGSRDLPAAPATGDASLRAGIEVTNPNTVKRTKTRKKQKSGPVDTGNSVTKSKMSPVDLTGDKTSDLTKTLKGKASKKKVGPAVSKAGLDDDIDKTIATFISKELQSDARSSSDPAIAGELAVPIDDPPCKTKRKSDKVKLGAGTNGTIPTVTQRMPNRVESTETSGAEANIIGEVNGRPTPELNVAGGEPHGSQSGSNLGPATLTSCPACLETVVHPLAACPVVQGRPDSIESRIAQMEQSPGLAPSSEVITSLSGTAEKARSIPSDSILRNDSSDMEPSQVSVPSVAKGSSIGAKSKIPKGHGISEVLVEARGKGSSSESSTEGENDGENPAQQRTPVNASSIHLHLEDQLVPLLYGSAKRGPRRSVLDEIPSSSETECKSSSEDLILDEEDLSLRPSHKQRKLSTTRPSSIEPEFTSEDEEDSSIPVYMDTPHDVLDHSRVPAIGVTGDHESIDAEVEASGRPEVDTYPREAGDQDHSISPQTEIDATAPPSQSTTKISGPASPKLDATAINVEAAKSPNLASTEQRTGRVLVPSSSPVIDGTTANTEMEAQSQDANDDVESAVEPPGDVEESDPIEPEPTQPLADRPSRGTDPVPRSHQRRASRTGLNPPPVSDQQSRRSSRLANRRRSVSNSGDTLIPLTQVRRRMTEALEKSVQSAKDEREVIRNDAEEAPREKSIRKQVRKSGNKPIRSTAQQSGDSGDDTSPSVAREDGSPISHVKRTNLPPSEQTKSNNPSVIDKPRTNSQGPLGKLSQSTSGAEKKTPGLTGSVLIPSERKKGSTQPLFIPGSSQVPTHAPSSPSESENESEGESEMAASLLPRKTPTKSKPPRPKFRRLTDLTSNNNTFFTKAKTAPRQPKNTPSVKEQLRFDGEDDDESSSSSSSEDRVPSSHIPRERRAGGSMRRKGRGLSSLGDK